METVIDLVLQAGFHIQSLIVGQFAVDPDQSFIDKGFADRVFTLFGSNTGEKQSGCGN
jgi:hypothetical protein